MRILTVLRQVLDAEEAVRVRNGVVDLENSKLVENSKLSMDAMVPGAQGCRAESAGDHRKA